MPPAQKPLRPLKTSTVIAAVLASVTVAVIAVAILVRVAGNDHGLRIDAIKTGLSIGVGSGGVFALLLGVQRLQLAQRKQIEDERTARIAHEHARQVAQASESDALERRITDLYTKAVDQLGGRHAVVRLGGLYALERLAQDNPQHRQTIVNVICAYLQMPFNTGEDNPGDDPATSLNGEHRYYWEWETRVTLAAEQIIARHLCWPGYPADPAPATYWPGINIDLSDAVLTNLDFSQCAFHGLDLRRVIFRGPTQFLYTSFERDALFEDARFLGNVSFRRASFLHRARFNNSEYHAGVSFRHSRFTSPPEFHDVSIVGDHPDRTWPPGWTELPHSDHGTSTSRRLTGPAS